MMLFLLLLIVLLLLCVLGNRENVYVVHLQFMAKGTRQPPKLMLQGVRCGFVLQYIEQLPAFELGKRRVVSRILQLLQKLRDAW